MHTRMHLFIHACMEIWMHSAAAYALRKISRRAPIYTHPTTRMRPHTVSQARPQPHERDALRGAPDHTLTQSIPYRALAYVRILRIVRAPYCNGRAIRTAMANVPPRAPMYMHTVHAYIDTGLHACIPYMHTVHAYMRISV